MMTGVSDDLRELYIDLVRKSLNCSLYEETDGTIYTPLDGARRALLRLLLPRNVRLTWRVGHDQRAKGGCATFGKQGSWPALALTMLGAKRLDNVQDCMRTVLKDGVPGDFIETGIWRGGSVILMRAILKAYGVTDRTVFAADSFEGLPKPDAGSYPPTRAIGIGPTNSLLSHWRRFAPISTATGFSTTRCGFLRAGSRTRCLRPRSSDSRWCASMGTCMRAQ